MCECPIKEEIKKNVIEECVCILNGIDTQIAEIFYYLITESEDNKNEE